MYFQNFSPSERDDEDNGSAADPWQSSRAILELLLKSEEKIRRMRDSVIREAGKLEYSMKYEPVMHFSCVFSNGKRSVKWSRFSHELLRTVDVRR